MQALLSERHKDSVPSSFPVKPMELKIHAFVFGINLSSVISGDKDSVVEKASLIEASSFIIKTVEYFVPLGDLINKEEELWKD